MRFNWLSWSNPVAIWWGFLVCVSAFNISLWVVLKHRIDARDPSRKSRFLHTHPMVVLSGVYVFVCAFRSVLPRADVQRIVLFNTWLSSVLVGRSLATIAELCFAAQWVIAVYVLSRLAGSANARNISYAILPLIFVAECCSWYAVITTNYLGNAIENSIWAVTFLLIAFALSVMRGRFSRTARRVLAFVIVGLVGYAAFEFSYDVPMYVARWQLEMSNGTQFLGFFAGMRDLASHWIVTHDFSQWQNEMAWMSLYFSLAVWMSLALCASVLIKDTLPRYLKK